MSLRIMYFLGFVTTSLMLIFGFYLEYFAGLIPCPLCILQRLALFILCVIFLIGWLINPRKRFVWMLSLPLSLIALLGAALAGRQIWLQHYPPAENGGCSVDLFYMLKVFPLNVVLKNVYQGGIDCAERGFEFLTLDIAEWTLICFLGFFIWALLLQKNLKRR